MVDFNQTVVLDGVNDFSIFGRDFSWDDGFIGRLRAGLDEGDTGQAELILRGSGWDIDLAKFSSDPAADMVIRDDGDGNRFINLIRLPDGAATVDLPFTEVNIVRGFSDQPAILSFGQFVDFVRTGDGDDQLTVFNGGLGAFLGQGNNTVRIAGGLLEFVKFQDGNNSLTIDPDGRAQHIRADSGDNTFDLRGRFDGLHFGDGDTTVTVDGDFFVASINGNSNEGDAVSVTLTGGNDLRSLALSNADDVVTVGGNSQVEQAVLGRGADTMTVQAGSRIDSLDLGSGDDTLIVDGGRLLQATATEGDDTVTLTNDARIDSLTLGDGANEVVMSGGSRVSGLKTFGGDDVVTLSEGARVESVLLGGGNNTLTMSAGTVVEQFTTYGEDDVVTLTGDARMQSVVLGSGANSLTVDGGSIGQAAAYGGDDVVSLTNGARVESLILGSGDNRLEMSAGTKVEQYTAYDGDDVVTLTGDAEVLSMTLGFGNNQVTTGTQFIQSILAFGGDDVATIGSGGAGQVRLSEGNNTVTAQGFVESVTAFDGNDSVRIDGGARLVGLGDGTNDLFTRAFVERISTGDGVDSLTVAGGASDLNSGAGDDLLRLGLNSVSSAWAGDGDDTIQVGLLEAGEFVEIGGGNGFDTIDMSQVGGDLDVDLRRRENDQGENGFFAITTMEAVIGGSGADRIAGNGDDNQLTGRGGEDVFIFDRNGANDIVTDFIVGTDKILLEGVQSAAQVSLSQGDGGVRLDYFDSSITFLGVSQAQIAQLDNFEL